jgi:hypothetical protein
MIPANTPLLVVRPGGELGYLGSACHPGSPGFIDVRNSDGIWTMYRCWNPQYYEWLRDYFYIIESFSDPRTIYYAAWTSMKWRPMSELPTLS